MPAKLQGRITDLLDTHGYTQPGHLLDNLLRRRQGIEQLQAIFTNPGYAKLLEANAPRIKLGSTQAALLETTQALIGFKSGSATKNNN